MSSSTSHKGVAIALLIIFSWFGILISLLLWQFSWPGFTVPLAVLLMTHLYTGLFITAHDAMHGVVSPPKPGLNRAIGSIAAFLFAFNSYKKLLPKHHEHHKYVATEKDPDYASKGFLGWYLKFVKEYVSWWQILYMAITFNILKLFLPTENLILFWILPSLLATLQLFYFGTYLPHRGEHEADNVHKARSQRKNHIWAFISCYFFGYHYEHHNMPWVPWWQLYKQKELAEGKR
jgi:beta-carotene ketolase (CrtW type)